MVFRGRLSGLLRHPDFLKLWAGQSISLVGSQVTRLALPFTAIGVYYYGSDSERWLFLMPAAWLILGADEDEQRLTRFTFRET